MSDKKRILIAEDSSVIVNLTKKILEFQNFEITAAKNGQMVIDLVKSDHFDVILMDINMPGMDGLECARRIRSMPDKAKSAIPIIAITGNARNLSMNDFKNYGINDYLQKPLNFDLLVERVKGFVNAG